MPKKNTARWVAKSLRGEQVGIAKPPEEFQEGVAIVSKVGGGHITHVSLKKREAIKLAKKLHPELELALKALKLVKDCEWQYECLDPVKDPEFGDDEPCGTCWECRYNKLKEKLDG